MKYRDFGTTGMKVSQLVFGGGAVGGLLINQDDETKLTAIRRAMEAGINWIDTAPSYGQGRSEEALGWLLKEIEEEVKKIKEEHGAGPGVVTILVGENPASISYVTAKIKTAKALGFNEIQDTQPEDLSVEDLLALVVKYN